MYTTIKQKLSPYFLSASVFFYVMLLLSIVQLKVPNKMLLLERFVTHGGWIEIIIVSGYGAFLAYKMQDIRTASKWRLISWTLFSAWFFLQLFLGIFASHLFLLTGKLHLPIPAMMIGGPIYRGQLSIMTILFLSTIVLSGPAWCSHLCYFGALDNQISSLGTAKAKPIIKNRNAIKTTIMFLFILIAILFRLLGFSLLVATLAGLFFGVNGLVIILIFSKKKGKMVHCVIYCPIGTLVNYFRFINPFRMYIDNSCTKCMACTPVCRYDALNVKDIQNKKPGTTCTLCGDCLKSCSDNSLHYKVFRLNPTQSRNLYLFITISLHAIFLAMGRI